MYNYTWNPIEYPFYGILDGNNNIIANMKIGSNASNQSNIGLFSSVYGMIKDLNLNYVDIDIRNLSSTTEINIGAFAGYLSGTVSNSHVIGNINSTVVNANLGGLIGYSSNSTITRSSNSADIISSSNTGGIVGYANFTTISSCDNRGSLTYTSRAENNEYNSIGGIVGSIYGSSAILNSFNGAQVAYNSRTLQSITLSPKIGLIVGYVDNPSLTYSNNTHLRLLSTSNLISLFGHNQDMYVGSGDIRYPLHFGYIRGVTPIYETHQIALSVYPSMVMKGTNTLTTSLGEIVDVSYLGFNASRPNSFLRVVSTSRRTYSYIEYNLPFSIESVYIEVLVPSTLPARPPLNLMVILEYKNASGTYIPISSASYMKLSLAEGMLFGDLNEEVTSFRLRLDSPASILNTTFDLLIGDVYFTHKV
jgi:hypothetical protein